MRQNDNNDRHCGRYTAFWALLRMPYMHLIVIQPYEAGTVITPAEQTGTHTQGAEVICPWPHSRKQERQHSRLVLNYRLVSEPTHLTSAPLYLL